MTENSPIPAEINKIEETKKIEMISSEKDIVENLNTLNERVNETKPGFDYRVSENGKFFVIYEGEELDIGLKGGKELLATMKLVKAILDDYKKKGFTDDYPEFYKTGATVGIDVDLKVDDSIILDDYRVAAGSDISKVMGSVLNVYNASDFENVRYKINYNTSKLANFLNKIAKKY